MVQLDGRVAVITSSTRGLGRGLADSFLAEGASVVLNGRSEEKGRWALDEMDGGDAVRFLAGDTMVRDDCERLIDEVISIFGMVNNAGGAQHNAPVAELKDEAFDEALRWNVWSTFWCTRRALNDMIARKWGRVINVSSLEGKYGKPIVSSYVTSNHAINGFTKSCAAEVGPLGITVNSLCPGAMDTDIMREVGPKAAAAQGMTYEQLLEWFSQESATKQMTEIADVATVAVLSPRTPALASLAHSSPSTAARRLTEGSTWRDSKVWWRAVSRGRDGVGRAIGEAYQREGAQVVLGDADASDERRAAEGVIDAAVERFGRLDVLVLVTSADPPAAPIAEMKDDHWTAAVDATLNHAFWGIRRALQHMVPRRQGPVIVVSSVAAKMAMPGKSAGAATEHGVTGLVKSAAHEVGTLGIKVNAIPRGVLDDEDSNAGDELRATFVERSAIKRANRVEEVANVSVMLASASLMSVTGCLFPVDGGTMPY